MNKFLYFLAFNFGFVALVYFGFVVGIQGAQYVVEFFVWALCLPVGLASLTTIVQKKLAIEKPRPIRRTMGKLIAWAALGVFVWTGHLATGGAWAFWMLCSAIARESMKKYALNPTDQYTPEGKK